MRREGVATAFGAKRILIGECGGRKGERGSGRVGDKGRNYVVTSLHLPLSRSPTLPCSRKPPMLRFAASHIWSYQNQTQSINVEVKCRRRSLPAGRSMTPSSSVRAHRAEWPRRN